MTCPKCTSNEVHVGRKGYSVGKAAIGAVLTGGLGVVAGAHGARKVRLTCLACGLEFRPGQKMRTAPRTSPLRVLLVLFILLVLGMIVQAASHH